MKPAQSIPPVPEEAYFRQFDLRDLDAHDLHSFWRVQYLRRIESVVASVVSQIPIGGSVLEIGSAQANMSLILAERGYRATAADLSEAALSYSRKKHEKGSMQWRCGDAFEMVFDAPFEAVILAELVEHVAEPELLIERAWNLVAPSGVLVITTPNAGAVTSRLPTYREAARDMARLRAEQYGPGGEHHLFALTMADLTSFAPLGSSVVERRHLCSLVISSHTQPLLRHTLSRGVVQFFGRITEVVPALRERLTTTILLTLRKANTL